MSGAEPPVLAVEPWKLNSGRSIASKAATWAAPTVEVYVGLWRGQTRMPVKAGPRMVGVSFVDGWPALVLSAREPRWPRTLAIGYAVQVPFVAWGVLADFMKNIAILGGMMYVIVFGAGPLSVDRDREFNKQSSYR